MFIARASLLASAALSGLCAANPLPDVSATTPIQERSSLLTRSSGNVVPLKRRADTSDHSSSALLRRQLGHATPAKNFQNFQYIAEISLGSQTFEVTIDTGSADTWVASDVVVCLDANGVGTACDYGPLFTGPFSGGANGQVFKASFGDGSAVNGTMGLQDVTIAGVNIPSTQIALVNSTSQFSGFNTTSGILGLAYPTLTQAFIPQPDGSLVGVDYDPVITSMIKQTLITPGFSLALDREGDRGFLTLGGLPPLNVTSEFVKTPILIRQITANPAQAVNLSFYSIEADNYAFGMGQQTVVNDTKFPVFIDSGSTFTMMPPAMVRAVVGMFQPPGAVDAATGLALADCKAVVPSFNVTIGGRAFPFAAADLLIQEQGFIPAKLLGGKCPVGVQASSDQGPFVLGDTFLNNVLAVFDIGATEMQFATVQF